MATTVIFVEIMIMGIIALVWLFLLSWRLGLVPLHDLNSIVSLLKDWNAAILILGGALAYQLGSLMNTTSFGIMEFLWGNGIKKSIMSPHDHEIASAIVNQKSMPQVVSGIQVHITYVRLARSALFNFFLLGMTLLLFDGFRGIAIVFLLLSLASYPIWRKIYTLRYQELRAAYDVIVDVNKSPEKTVASA